MGVRPFPEIMYRCYLVNCPTVFRAVWAVVKPMINKDIQKKIRIMGKVEGAALEAGCYTSPLLSST